MILVTNERILEFVIECHQYVIVAQFVHGHLLTPELQPPPHRQCYLVVKNVAQFLLREVIPEAHLFHGTGTFKYTAMFTVCLHNR